MTSVQTSTGTTTFDALPLKHSVTVRRSVSPVDDPKWLAGLGTTGTVLATSQQIGSFVSSNFGRGRILTASTLRAKERFPQAINDAFEAVRESTGKDPRGIQALKARVQGTIKGVKEIRPQQILRDCVVGATKDTVPLRGGTIKMFGKVLTTNGWQASLRAGSLLGLGVLGLTAASVAVNLGTGIAQKGVSGVTKTYQGRTGVLTAAGAAIGVTPALFAAFARRNPAVLDDLGRVLIPRQGKLDAFLASDWLQQSKVKVPAYIAGLGFGPLVAVNLAGGFNFMNERR